MITTEARDTDLAGLVDLLRKQNDVKYDVVVTQDRLSFADGQLVVAGAGAIVTDEGVTETDLRFDPTEVFDGTMCERLGIPRAYFRTLRDRDLRVGIDGLRASYDPEADVPLAVRDVSVLDANVNGWLQADPGKKMLVRAFHTGDPADTGIARAFLSDRFGVHIDNYDVILAALDAVRAAGVGFRLDGADLTERTMRVRLYSPDVVALAPTLLANYRSPFDSRHGADRPIVWGGLEIRNSETGGGAFTIVPRFVVEVCTNGMTRPQDALREVHLGGRLDEGVVRWSGETQQRAVELVKAKTTDAVRSFLDREWVQAKVTEIEAQAGAPVADAVSTIERVGKACGYSQAEQASILDCFIRSGDLTAGGVMQAVTAAARGVESSDRAMVLEDTALDVLALAAR